jgi:GNAT superfamily N-acetyltransferase
MGESNNSMRIDIKVAEPAEAQDVATMVEELLAGIMVVVGQQVFRIEQDRTRALAHEWLRKGTYQVLLAKNGASGDSAGFLALYEGYALYAGGRVGIIPELYVRSAYRSQGIGARLVGAAIEVGRARGWTRLEVTTPPLPQFDRTLAFYERQGFVVSGGRKLKMDLP